MVSSYPACFYKEEAGYSVIFPDLNWLATCGETLEEADAMAQDCLAGFLYSQREDREPVPPPSRAVSPEAVARDLGIPAEGGFVRVVSVDAEAYAQERFGKSRKWSAAPGVRAERRA